MPHLFIPRKGWENERLAAYLLSRFSFVAHPTSVADDLGSDFFCTLFEVEHTSGGDVLAPRSSFAIQVKSSANKVPADNKIDYFMRLELPFFIGYVRQNPPEMKVYSAEFLPVFFAEVGRPSSLSLRLVAEPEFDVNNYFERTRQVGKFVLRCPHVVTVNVNDDRSAIQSTGKVLLKICTRTLGNIGTRLNQEHIYKVDESGNHRIVAGIGSEKHFRKNFLKRLAEVFKNLDWELDAGRPAQDVAREFSIFEQLYMRLQSEAAYIRQFEFASTQYLPLKTRLDDVAQSLSPSSRKGQR